ncbi:SPOR domain-containing protein [Glaciecola sp. KUL10]|uniref:SPOR domain-containing protein n=1 Tax=Glaciecola sp. (strain KUL10) TaxID=2161813 RepID=UPI000D78BAFC|nr:SPOR domain-containing protein [Glaciecola sp. KUL10]GBL03998.1 hypothetical protein KUL10_13000 [Glaciecola sp. KUL10]
MIVKRNQLLIAITVVSTQLSLAGCASLPSVNPLNWFSEENKALVKNDDNQNIPQIDYFNETIESEIPLTTQNTDEVIEEVAVIIDQWQEMQPKLARLIEFESDLSYFIDNFQDASNKPSFNQTPDIPRFDAQSNLAQADSFEAVATESELTELAANLNGSSMPIQPAVQLQSVQQVLGSSEGVSRDKFSGLDQAFTPSTTEGVVKEKFSGFSNTDASPIISQTSNVECLATQSDGFSMHLASFKNRNAALEIIQKYKQVVPKDNSSCLSSGSIAEVVVNGVKFYSARIGLFSSREKAVETCSVVRKEQDYCGVALYKGEAIL